MNELDQFLREKQELINRTLTEYIPKTGPSTVQEAMTYSLQAGGKRLRPIMTLAVAETLEHEDSSVIDVACAMEFVHTYSLIHDDLPAMDNSDLRRGKPTCHRIYGNGIAVLAGDALLTLAFEVLAGYGRKTGSPDKALKIIAELSRASGVDGMIGGQNLDLESEGRQISEAELEEMSGMKTGALLKASVISGAIAANATEEEEKMLTEYALSIGTAFQIADDLLDYESSEAEIGKPAGSDRERFKPNYPSVLGIQEARRRAEVLHERALASLEGLNKSTELLSGLAGKMVYRKK